MGLSLVVGPAHAGKVASLLDRFVAAIDRDPWLIVPNRSDVERVERELVRREGGLLAGTIGTFDTLFEALARGDGLGRRLVGEAERAVVVRRVVEAGPDDAGRTVPRVSPTPSDGHWRSSTARSSTPTTSTSRSRRSSAPTATSSTGSMRGIAGCSVAGASSG